MDCSIYVVKTKALISFAVTVKLICIFVFAYAKSRFSHDAAHFMQHTNLLLDQVEEPCHPCYQARGMERKEKEKY